MRAGGTTPISAREKAQNKRQGSSGKTKSGKVKRSAANAQRPVPAPKPMQRRGDTKPKPTLKPYKAPVNNAGTYKGAKKNAPNLDKLIARRNKLTKGTPEYNRVQNQINSAYGKGPQRNASITKLAAKKTAPVSSGTKKPTLQLKKTATPTAPKTPAQKRKAAAAKRKTGRKASAASRKDSRATKAASRSSKRMAKGAKRTSKKADRKGKRNAIKAIRRG